jgi:hypothetical protein
MRKYYREPQGIKRRINTKLIALEILLEKLAYKYFKKSIYLDLRFWKCFK